MNSFASQERSLGIKHLAFENLSSAPAPLSANHKQTSQRTLASRRFVAAPLWGQPGAQPGFSEGFQAACCHGGLQQVCPCCEPHFYLRTCPATDRSWSRAMISPLSELAAPFYLVFWTISGFASLTILCDLGRLRGTKWGADLWFLHFSLPSLLRWETGVSFLLCLNRAFQCFLLWCWITEREQAHVFRDLSDSAVKIYLLRTYCHFTSVATFLEFHRMLFFLYC